MPLVAIFSAVAETAAQVAALVIALVALAEGVGVILAHLRMLRGK